MKPPNWTTPWVEKKKRNGYLRKFKATWLPLRRKRIAKGIWGWEGVQNCMATSQREENNQRQFEEGCPGLHGYLSRTARVEKGGESLDSYKAGG